MRLIRLALWPLGVVLGVGAEVTRHEGSALTAVDFIVGFTLIALGLLAWEHRPESWSGILLAASGVAWFLGNFASWALYLHRGPLVHLVLSYPSGRLRSRLERAVVAGGYVYAAVYPLARNDVATIVFAFIVAATAVRRRLAAGGPERRARTSALGAAAALGPVLALAAATRLAGTGAARPVLLTYDTVVGLVGGWLFAGLFWGRWAQATVTGLVVDLGEPGDAATLRDRLARALGDPSLVLGYWLPGQGRYVDEAGKPVEFPAAGAGRAVTEIERDGERLAALFHDESVLGDLALVSDIASAAGLAVANVRLHAQIQTSVAEVEASRRRIVEAADGQRRRLERELREGAEARLAVIASLLEECGPPLLEVGKDLDAARAELREFALGIHPPALSEGGLTMALGALAARSVVSVKVDAKPGRLSPAVEVAAYFVCSEALANVAKYAEASSVTVFVATKDGRLLVEVTDDGIGGADPSRGSGLRGLADRMEALGGRLYLESRAGRGTRVVGEIPLTWRGATD